MKRTLLVLCLATAVSTLFAQTQATLRDIKGKVEVKRLGKAWAPAKDGMVVDTLATISTGFDSRVTLAIADNRIAVSPLTRLTVDKIIEQAGTAGTSLHLRVGKVSAEVKSSKGTPQDFKITSPYSTASVRGTSFTYDGFVLDVNEGRVAFIPGRPKRDIVIPAAVLKKKAAATKAEGEQAQEAAAGEGAAEGATTEATETEAAEAESAVPESEMAEAAAEEGGAETPEGEAAEGEVAKAPEGEAAAPEAPAEATEEGPDLASFMALVQTENPDDDFGISDEAGAAVSLAPAPQAAPQQTPTTEGGTTPAAATPTPAAPAPAAEPQAILVAAGSVAVISIDYSAPVAADTGGKKAPTTQVATGLAGTVNTGAGGALTTTAPKIETPTYVPPAATPTTGKIKLRWEVK
jgi:hypothetical protein